MSRSPATSRKATTMKSLKEKWLSIVQLTREKGENDIVGSSIVTLPPLLLQDSDSSTPSVSHSGSGCAGCSCGWATGAHMTELSTYGTGAHVASSLGVSWGSQSTKGADILRALGANIVTHNVQKDSRGLLSLDGRYLLRLARVGTSVDSKAS